MLTANQYILTIALGFVGLLVLYSALGVFA